MAVRYESVIGLEVHCQLETASKLFSACPLENGAPANTRTDALSWGLPGALPVPNRKAVESAIAIAVATGCAVHRTSTFARKHYTYPDLPKGYQITQGDEPYATGGALEIPGDTPRRIRLQRIHLEEDAGKNVHVGTASGVDYNRAGAPLVEIVSEPDLRSADEAAACLREIRALVRALGISHANMEEGTLRCDANVSLRPIGTGTLGVRCEIKNVASFRFLARAIEAEVRRQSELLARGEPIVRCTLGYDHDRDRLFVMRTKEDAADYRWLPDPDLPPLVIDDAWVAAVRNAMPPLPAARRARWRALGVAADDASLLASERELADYFDALLDAVGPRRAKRASSWLVTEVLGRVGDDGIAGCPVSPALLGELVALVDDGAISGPTAKHVLDRCWAGEGSPRAIVDAHGLAQVSDVAAIDALVAEVFAAHAQQVASLRAGKLALRGFLIGQVMRASGGRANPTIVGERLDAAVTEEGKS
jgi:aspartyl-tRNA(Asn)/glutamyl-tRNA(Gln) amidotransferase subunit B